MEYQRQITIATPLEKAHGFIKEVKHLPIWTRFFKRCINENGSSGEMETPLGRSSTSIQEEHNEELIKLWICSQFEHRQEKALVTLKGNQDYSIVTFQLKVPPEVSEEQRSKMVLNLEDELRFLKKHLESNDD